MEARRAPGSETGWAGRLRARVAQSDFFRRAHGFYRRHERYAPPLFFFGGVLWDALTLKRIDAWFDNLILLVYLAALGGLILVTALVEYESTTNARLRRYREWFPHGVQFFLGALFSAYMVFYFQSASLTPTLGFVVLLAVLLVANEFIHRRLFNLYLLLALYFLAACSFFIFFIPVVTKWMSYATFLAGGLLSAALVALMLVCLWRRAVFKRKREYVYSAGSVAVLFALLNVFYVQNWIPPVPLAMRFGGVFHHVSRAGDAYDLRFERSAWYAFWIDSDRRFRRAEGEAVYCFAAVFAPTQLKKKIYHQWSFYDAARQVWVETDRIGYQVVGGRFDGYRGYTFKQNVHPGRWRVDVETEAGQIIGRIRFEIVPVAAPVTKLRQVFYE